MNQFLKRIVSLCLLLAMAFGLVSGVTFPKAAAASSDLSVRAEDSENLLKNPGFESVNTNGLPKNWSKWGNPSLAVVNATDESANVYEGNYALKVTATAATDTAAATVGGMQSDLMEITGGLTYNVTVYAKENYTNGSGFQIYIQFHHYDETAKKYVRDAAVYTTTSVIGDWNYYEVSGTAPANSTHASVLLTSGGGKGSVYFDKVTFVEEGVSQYAPVEFDGDWEQIYSDYPRLDFDKAGLQEIIDFSTSSVVSAYGYSGTGALTKLLTAADKYVAETELSLTYLGTTTVVYPLHPVLEDPTCREEFETAPGNFSPTYRYPYMTSFGSNMVTRMQTLSLAYAITGDVKYGERAKQYALDICSWQYWAGYHETLEEGSELSSQASGYILDCVMYAYDLCHDLFTAEEIAKMDAQIIEKGLEAMYHDCWPRMIRDRDMDHATGLILASCLIMNESNAASLKKYLDMGMTYINWRLDYFLKSGVNEGHMYDSLAVDDIIATLHTLQRVTGYAGPFDHKYMDELEKRVLGFFEMVDGVLPAYSDSQFKSTYYPYTAAYLSRNGNEIATYYLAVGGALSIPYDQFVWHTDMPLSEVKTPDGRVGNVTYLGSHGQGALRTGWGTLDSLLVINANDTNSSHNHFDQNSIMLAFNGKWMLNDSEYKDNAYTTITQWEMKYTNSTVFVDGKPQVTLGKGALEQVFNTHLYGYFLGSAPEAYGMEERLPVLNKFDRHTIMVNHNDHPYYIVIDDLESNKDRNFGWNFYVNGKLTLDDELYTGYWDQVEMDGKVVANGTTATGNKLTLSKYGCTLHSYFVGQKVTTKEVTYETHGPTLLVENTTASKDYQFMNILSVERDTTTQYTTRFADLIGNPDLINLKQPTGNIFQKCTVAGEEMVKYILEPNTGYTGAGIGFIFNVPEDGEYFVTVDMGQTMTTDNYWNIYISGIDADNNGKTDCLSAANVLKGPEGVRIIDCGKQYLTAGDHEVYIIISGSAEAGATVAMGGINLRKAGATMGESAIKVLESYDNGDLLGATIGYGTTLKDVVLFNRGTGTIVGGTLSTNGQQASVLGVNGTDISEGYAVTNGTSLKYGDLVLMTAAGPISVAVDFTMAKEPVKNGAGEPETDTGFNVLDPIVYLSTKAEKATNASIYLGQDVNYNAYIDGKLIDSTYADGVLTLAVPAGEHQITVTGAHFHDWAEATCDTPKTCTLCGETEGEALGHTWIEANCTESKHCSVCGAAEGGPKHYAASGVVCEICGKTFGYCNDAVTWTLDANGVLTISGVGAMPDYNSSNKSPWNALSSLITKVVIADGVTNVGNYAFYNMTDFSSVVMGKDVASVGNSAFRGCTGLTFVQLGVGTKELVTRAFYACSNLETVVILDELTNVANYAFYNCKKLANVYYCGTEEQWSEITVGSQNTYLTGATKYYHNWQDANCTSPKYCIYCGLTEGDVVHQWVDANCTTPKTCSVCGKTEGDVWHNVVNGICTVCNKYGTCGENAFWTLDAEGTLTIFGTGAMTDYTGITGTNPAPWYPQHSLIKKAVIDDGITTIGKYAFVLCDKLAEVEMSETVTVVRYASFHQCRVLERIVIGAGVTTIEQQAFAASSKLAWIALPESIQWIDDGAFYKCTGLTTIVYCGTDEQWSNVTIDSGTGTNSNEWLLNATRTQHDWAGISCTEPAFCTVCGQSGNVGSGTHSWIAATCTSPKTCSVCGETEGEALGHSYVLNIKEATCEEPGIAANVCSACGDTQIVNEVPAKGHDYVSQVTKEPTCNEAGIMTYFCMECNHSYTESITELEHNYVLKIKEATCEEPGIAANICSHCGDTQIINEVPALGHSYVSQITKEPTCEETGVRTYVCMECLNSYTEDVAKAEHQWNAATCTAPKTCAVCGATEGEKLEHSFTNYVSDGNATFTSDGTKTAKCDNCDATDTITDEGSMLTAVAQIGENLYASLEAAMAAAKSGDVVVLLMNTTITADAELAASVTYQIPAGLTLTIAEGVTVTANAAATVNCAGTIVVAGKADISELHYGTTFGAMGGKLTIPATGAVMMLKEWEGVWTPVNDAQFGAMLVGCESGAYVEVGSQQWTLTDDAWTHMNHTYADAEDETCDVCGATRVLHDIVNGICTICGNHGTCGENLTWTLNAEGVLTVIGSGIMADYTAAGQNPAPWIALGDSLKKVVIEAGVTVIGANAFYGCNSLTDVVIADSVTVIGEGAFRASAALTNVSIGSGVTTIGNDAFRNCSSLKSIVLPDSVTSIGNYAFRGTDLESIQVSKNLTSIGYSAFYGCTGLKTFDIPAGVNYMGGYAFYGCTGLTEIVIPEGIAGLGSYTFYNCSGLTKVVMSAGTVGIMASAFEGCTSLTTVVYCGTEEQWSAINIRDNNTALSEAKRSYHDYDNDADDTCNICGAVRDLGPATDANLKFNAAPGLSFKDYIGMQILVTSQVAKNYDRVWIEAVQADPAGDVTTILEGVPYFYNIYLKFEQQVLSWSMAENITLTLWAEKDGVTVQGETFSGSVEDLALAKIAEYAAANNTAAVTALVDMLNYGAAVQTSFNHNADMLPNTKLGDYTGTTATPEFNATNSITGTGTLAVASNSISMQAKVEIQLLIMGKIDGYTVSATVGGAAAPVVVDTEKYAAYNWTLVKVAVAADKMREVYTISINDANGTPVTPVYNVSVEAYGKTQLEGAKADVVIAMMRYGDSVAAL